MNALETAFQGAVRRTWFRIKSPVGGTPIGPSEKVLYPVPTEAALEASLLSPGTERTFEGTCIGRCSNRHSQLDDDQAHRTWISILSLN